MKNELPVVKIFGIKIIRYRIVRDNYLGYECQKWRIWFLFWLQMGVITNTHISIERAISYINGNSDSIVLSS